MLSMTPETKKYIIQKAYPGAQLENNGDSQVAAGQGILLSAILPDGSSRTVALQQYSATEVTADPQVASHEFQLLEVLHRQGLPVPLPLYAEDAPQDDSPAYLVSELVDGRIIDGLADSTDYAQQMAATLAKVHKMPIPDHLHFLAARGEVELQAFGPHTTRDGSPDVPLVARIHAELSAHPPHRSNQPTLVHGNFGAWVVMQKDGHPCGITHWRSAHLGDPLTDVASARVDLLLHSRHGAMEAFTDQYKSIMTTLDYHDLLYWDLRAALHTALAMESWGMDEPDLQNMRLDLEEFVEQVVKQSGH